MSRSDGIILKLGTVEFLYEIERKEQALDIAYQYVMKEITFEDLINFEDYLISDLCYYLPFDPADHDGRDIHTLELLRLHFEDREEYEKCARLRDLISDCS